MPDIYPAAPPTISNDLVTISRFLANPTALRRRLRTFQDMRFVSDQVLTGRYVSSGGAVLYEQSEPIETDRDVEQVAPGAEYPMANITTGTAAIAAVAKWGQAVPVTDEEVKRNVYGGQVIDRNLRKVVNTIIDQVDSVTMSAVLAACTTHVDAADGWNAQTTTNILRDILLAVRAITDLKMGYKPDTLLVDDLMYAYLMSDEKIQTARQRETSTNPVYTGQIDTVAGLVIIHSPNAPANPYVLDATQLGGMADETGASPGYAVSDLAVEVKSIRKDETDSWKLQGRRLTVPVVQETGAAVYIDGATATN
jgi:hypothetical protein